MSNIIFARHGQSDGNANGYIAKADTMLTGAGVAQAKETGSKLKDKGITKIVCSPMIRAKQTAEVIATVLGIDVRHIEILSELRERGFGQVEGKPKEHESEWYFTTDDSSLGIESREDLTVRMRDCLNKLSSYPENDVILAVGHAVSGYYLAEVADGKAVFKEFRPPQELLNADFIEFAPQSID